MELVDITRDWVSSFMIFFTAADFSCCLFVGLSTFSCVFSKWNACSIRLRSGDWLDHCRKIHLFTFKNSWVTFAVCFGSLCICTMTHHPINFAAFSWIWADSISLYTSEFIRLLLSSTMSSKNTSNQCHWKPCTLMPSHCSTMFHRWCCMLWIMSCSKPSPYFYLPVILTQVDVNFRISKECFSRSGLFKKIFFWQSLIWPCLHLVVNSLYFLSWSFDCRLWQWHSDLLESVLLLAGCC